MGFFKEFKDDLSQAVSELIPEQSNSQEEKESEEMVNTLDQEEQSYVNSPDNARMKELLDEFTQNNTAADTDNDSPEKTSDTNQVDAADNNAYAGEQGEEDIISGALEADSDEAEFTAEALCAEDASGEGELETQDEHQECITAPKQKASSPAKENEVTVISKGTVINGSISAEGSLDIMGTVTGDIDCLGKLSIAGKVTGNISASEVYVNTERLEGSIICEGNVKVALGTVVIGDITSAFAMIAGAVKGEIDINGPVIIDSTAIIKGNIKAKSVQINNGAVIEGFCSLSYANVDVNNIFE